MSVEDSAGGNVALNKPASFSRCYAGTDAMKAVCGLAAPRNHPNHWHAADAVPNNWWMVDMQADCDVSRVVFYNRQDCCCERAEGTLLQLLDEKKNVLATRVLNRDLVQPFAFHSGVLQNGQFPPSKLAFPPMSDKSLSTRSVALTAAACVYLRRQQLALRYIRRGRSESWIFC